MKIYNTLTTKKEELIPLSPNQFKIYACGPTVYNFIHIGNARPLCVFDAFRRYLEYRGNKVDFVQNFTDIDDKIIKKANDEGVAFTQITEKYIAEFWQDAKGLGIREATVHPKATENIEEIIDIIKTLEEKGFAYNNGGDVYYRTGKFEEYGKLSHQPLEALQSGARIAVGEQKEDPMDFALWKAAKPGEPYWDSPWGQGRPGWHIECSAMSRRYLGKTIDIHAGGEDLIFPHHENEIAQSEACNGVPFARYWMHNGFINIDNQKMSKSLGNFKTVREAAAAFGYETIRYFMLASHYRSPINYSIDVLNQSKAALERLYNFKRSLEFTIANAAAEEAVSPKIAAKLESYRESFISHMDDDFNTAAGISVIFELVRYVNGLIAEQPSKALAEQALSLFNELTDVLGLLYAKEETSESDAEIDALIEQRTQARSSKNWAEADRIRDELKARNVVLEDTAQGVKWHYNV
ncbi:MAG: cysteine--tRNA ligase [Oscillospiraceae bacterium]|jgi:cysteinyl-tRNA synthetase|nr:cysteine--tRNA ligase [Oscillospiraceae bacterium]